MKISATIIARDEESNIAAACESVAWADEIVVVDSGSTDRTVELATNAGAKVIVNAWPGFSEQKQFAVDHAANDWIFSLDADERVTDRLKNEILKLKHDALRADGYRVPRLSIYMGRKIRHGGWYPDLQLRFFNRQKGRWNGAVIHESVQMDEGAQIGRLNGDLLHYSVENAEHHHRMIVERYAPLGAEKMLREGRRTSTVKAYISAGFAFFRGYVVKSGFMDGRAGYAIARFAAQNVFTKHRLLMERQRAAPSKE